MAFLSQLRFFLFFFVFSSNSFLASKEGLTQCAMGMGLDLPDAPGSHEACVLTHSSRREGGSWLNSE